MFHVPCILKGSAMWKVSCTKKKNVELGDQNCQKVLKKKQGLDGDYHRLM